MMPAATDFSISSHSCWMLPIQISFFAIIAIMGIDFFVGIGANSRSSVLTMTVFGIMAILLGILRYITGKPFPTAFFLLINVAFLGVFYKAQIDGAISAHKMKVLIVIFEVTLFLAVLLSYSNMFFYYVGAYNLGILLTFFAEKKQICLQGFKWLGGIGYTFFLGSEIVYIVLSSFNRLFSSSAELRIFACFVQLALSLLFAYLVPLFDYNCLLINSHKDYYICVPFRSNINHN